MLVCLSVQLSVVCLCHFCNVFCGEGCLCHMFCGEDHLCHMFCSEGQFSI